MKPCRMRMEDEKCGAKRGTGIAVDDDKKEGHRQRHYYYIYIASAVVLASSP